MPRGEIVAPGEEAAGARRSEYRAGYEAGLRHAARARNPFTGPAPKRNAAALAEQAAAWAAGHARGCEDAGRGVTYSLWQQTGRRAGPKSPTKRRARERVPGEQSYRRTAERGAYRKGYFDARAGKGVSDCPHPAAGLWPADQITPALRKAWLAGHALFPRVVIREVHQALREEGERVRRAS